MSQMASNTPIVVAKIKVLPDMESVKDAAQKINHRLSQPAGSGGIGTSPGGAAAWNRQGVLGGVLNEGPYKAGFEGGAAQAGSTARKGLFGKARDWFDSKGASFSERLGKIGEGLGGHVGEWMEKLREKSAKAGGAIGGAVGGIFGGPAGAAVGQKAGSAIGGSVGGVAAIIIGTGVALEKWGKSQLAGMLQLSRYFPSIAQIEVENEWRDRRRGFIQGQRLATSSRFLMHGRQFAGEQWDEAVAPLEKALNYVLGAFGYAWGGFLKLWNSTFGAIFTWFEKFFGSSTQNVNGIYLDYWHSIADAGYRSRNGNRPRLVPAPWAPGTHAPQPRPHTPPRPPFPPK